MPCKYHHCIPCHEENIPSIDHFLSRPLKRPVFALARVANYTLAPRWKINTESTLVGTLSQLSTHAKLFMEFKKKIEADIPLQQLRGRVIGSGWTE